MRTIIKANKYIQDGFSADEAEKLLPEIKKAVLTGEPFEINFEGVQFFTTLFFSTALTYLVGEMGDEEYKNRIHVRNLSESGEETYKHALDYSIEYYKKTSEEQEQERIITIEEAEEL